MVEGGRGLAHLCSKHCAQAQAHVHSRSKLSVYFMNEGVAVVPPPKAAKVPFNRGLQISLPCGP